VILTLTNIVITGWYGAKNAGDEAILAALLYQLRRKGYSNLSVLSYDPAYTTTLHNVKAYPEMRLDLYKSIEVISNADLLIVGGGGLLKDEGKYYPLLLIKCLLARLFKTKIILSAVGVGPFYRSFGKWVTRQIARVADVITVRDRESLDLLYDIGVRRDVHVTGDLALCLPDINPNQVPQSLKFAGFSVNPGTLRIAVSLRPWYHMRRIWPDGKLKYAQFLDKFADAIDQIDALYNPVVVFIPMQYEQDVPVGKELYTRLSSRKEFDLLFEQGYNYLEISTALANFDILIGMRLHSLIFASLSYTPIVSVSYSSKVSSFIKSLQSDKWNTSIDSLVTDDLVKIVQDSVNQRETVIQSLKNRVPGLRNKSLDNFSYIESLIQER
jgi:polysaccharide pyruvyl transferase CsaB